MLDTKLLERASHLRQIMLVHLASRHGRMKVVAATVGVEHAEQPVAGYRLADAVEA